MLNIQVGDYVKVSDMTGKKGYRRSWKGTVVDTCQEFFVVQTKHYKICFNYVDVLIDDIRVNTLRRDMNVNQ